MPTVGAYVSRHSYVVNFLSGSCTKGWARIYYTPSYYGLLWRPRYWTLAGGIRKQITENVTALKQTYAGFMPSLATVQVMDEVEAHVLYVPDLSTACIII